MFGNIIQKCDMKNNNTSVPFFYQLFSAWISLQNIPFYRVDVPITTGPYLRGLEI